MKLKSERIKVNWSFGGHEKLPSLCDATQPAECRFHQLHSVFSSLCSACLLIPVVSAARTIATEAPEVVATMGVRHILM